MPVSYILLHTYTRSEPGAPPRASPRVHVRAHGGRGAVRADAAAVAARPHAGAQIQTQHKAAAAAAGTRTGSSAGSSRRGGRGAAAGGGGGQEVRVRRSTALRHGGGYVGRVDPQGWTSLQWALVMSGSARLCAPSYLCASRVGGRCCCDCSGQGSWDSCQVCVGVCDTCGARCLDRCVVVGTAALRTAGGGVGGPGLGQPAGALAVLHPPACMSTETARRACCWYYVVRVLPRYRQRSNLP